MTRHPTTVRLYETDSHLTSFSAVVLSCQAAGNEYDVALDRTAFFPTGGGQPCDSGLLAGQPVRNVRIENNVVLHTLSYPLPEGEEVMGEIDGDLRLRRMANHTGEHILSSVMAKRHGLSNVGFHMGSRDVTCDFDGILEEGAIVAVEDEVNRLIREDHPVFVSYPSPEHLASLTYRSKIALTESVRLVSIGENGEIDRCACCAPHVPRTGEIGLLRIVGSEHYKGGMRLHILCGADALDHIRDDAVCLNTLSRLLSAKPEGKAISEAVLHLLEETKRQKEILSQLNDRLSQQICNGLTPSHAPLCLFDSRTDPLALRKLAGKAREMVQGLVAVFGGNDEDGYRFVLCADEGAKAFHAALSRALPFRGGGSDTMICGSVNAKRAEIEDTFARAVQGESQWDRT